MDTIRTYDDLKNKYPEMFEDCIFDLQDGHGWFPIIECLCNLLQKQSENNKHLGTTQVKVQQVKQKFGGLRFYVNVQNGEYKSENCKWFDWSNFVHGAISMAEALAFRTCEDCGNEAKGRVTNGYYYTACDEHVRKSLNDFNN